MDIKEITPKLKQVAEAYSKKYDIELSEDYLILKLQEEMGEFIQSFLQNSNRARKKGKTEKELREDFEEEFTDVLGMLLLIGDRYDIDIEKSFKKKWLSKIEFDYK